MSLTINGKNPETITIGGKAVESLSISGEIVWSVAPSGPDYFYIENAYPGNNDVTLTKNGSPTTGTTLEYSSDKTNWTSCTYDSNNQCVVSLPNRGDRVYFRSTDGFSQSSSNYYNIKSTQAIKTAGDLRTLLDYTDISLNTATSYGFYQMFAENITGMVNVIDYSKLTTLSQSCYNGMFYRCTGLTVTGPLPAINLAKDCYSRMFYGCSTLTSIPSFLPATTLITGCYSTMFRECAALVNAPNMNSVTSIGDKACSGMFESCTNLINPPDMSSVTSIGSQGCKSMFYNCAALVNPPDISSVTTVGNTGMQGMFQYCTSLTTSPVLKVITLSSSAYSMLFFGCSSLNKVTTYAQDVSAGNCLGSWLYGVAASGDFYNLGGATYPSGDSGIPSGWTVHTSL